MSNKSFVITGSIQGNIDEDTLNQEFLEWIESKGLYFFGLIQPFEDEEGEE